MGVRQWGAEEDSRASEGGGKEGTGGNFAVKGFMIGTPH